MADKDLTIGIKTTGDTSGAVAVEKSIFKIEDAAKSAEREMDDLEAKSRKLKRESGGEKTGGLLGANVSELANKAGEKLADKAGFGAEYKSVAGLVSADALAVAGSFAAIGTAAVASYNLMSGTVDGYKKLMEEAKLSGQSLGPELEREVKELETFLAPITTIVTTVKTAWESMVETVTHPIDTLSGLADLKKSLSQAKEQLDKLDALRLKMATATGTDLAKIYKAEAEGLKDQEETLARIATLRGQLQSIEQQRAARQIKIAQQDGGDVGLAEANALAVRLKVEVAALAENLRQSEAAVRATQKSYDAAFSAYNRALTDNVDKLKPEDFAKLSTALDAANKELQKSQTIAGEQARLFADAKANVAEDVEVALIDLKDKYQGAVTKEAGKAFDTITDSLKETLATGPSAAIEQIKVEVGTITTAATDQQTQVKASLDTERAGTVQAIQQLAPTPQDTAAIGAAVKEVGKAIAAQGNATISALGALTTTVGQLTARVQKQQQQINQLFSRGR